MAIDRKAYINTLYKGDAQLPRTLANPGTWGYATRRLPGRLGRAARADPGRREGQAADQGRRRHRQDDRHRHVERDQPAQHRRQRRPPGGDGIGLKAKLKSVSAANYINFFTDPEGARGRRRVPHASTTPTTPIRPRSTTRSPCRRQPELRRLRGPADHRRRSKARAARPTRRSARRHVARGRRPIMQTLPWIPLRGAEHGADHGQARSPARRPRSCTWAARGRNDRRPSG